MLAFSDATPIYLFTAPTDMRKSFDGLSGLIEQHLGASSVTDGSLFVFVNRRRDRMKVMGFDGDGLAIWYKRLEAGRYELPMNPMGGGDVRIDARQLRLILDGVDLGSVKRRKRYAKPPARNALDSPSAKFRGVTDDDRATHRTTRTT
jgi:transposase